MDHLEQYTAYAAAALMGQLARGEEKASPEDYANAAHDFAEAMMEVGMERGKSISPSGSPSLPMAPPGI